MMNDTLASALNVILNAQRIGKKECTVTPVSTVMKKVFDIMNHHKYLGAYEATSNKTSPQLKVHLLGMINKCGVIKPRFPVKKDGYEKFEKRYLPARDMGILIVSTSEGMMTHHEAKKKSLGGTLVAYVY